MSTEVTLWHAKDEIRAYVLFCGQFVSAEEHVSLRLCPVQRHVNNNLYSKLVFSKVFEILLLKLAKGQFRELH